MFESVDIKMLSENLLKAREICGKSIKEVSSIIGIPSSRLKNYENGKYVPSLPELESLSYLYRIPLFALLENNLIDDHIHNPNENQIQKLIEIRQRLISTRIQLAREKEEISYKKLSEITGVSTSKLKKYESGELPIPLDELVKINQTLGVDSADIEDKNSPIGKWQTQQVTVLNMTQLPDEISSFINKTESEKYIFTAMEISKIGTEKLNQLANSLLEITNNKSEKNDSNET